jgi:hypothetical protein
MKKQTAGNNLSLGMIKNAMNAPIFKRASIILNTDGAEALNVYMSGFFPGRNWHKCVCKLSDYVEAIRAAR